jgi:hypothetical protein
VAISIEGVVSFVFWLIIVAAVFGLLYWLLCYLESQFNPGAPFFKIGRVVLVILGVFVLIGVILSLAGHPVFRLAP